MNNVALGSANPVAGQGTVCAPSSSNGGALSFNWVSDVDALEAIQPGHFVNQPITASINFSGDGNLRSGSLVVREEKKQ